MALRRLGLDAFWGGAELRIGAPRLEAPREALYLPRGAGPCWGLYDREGRILEAAIDRWGVEGRLMGQSAEPAAPPPDAARSDERFLYIGPAQLHYGHFLVETLARCWPLARSQGGPGTKLLVHGGDLSRAWGGWLGHAFVADIFGLLGFTAADIVHFDRPTWCADVRVPEPALQQQAFAYPAHREIGRLIGRRALQRRRRPSDPWRWLAAPRTRADARPAWLSRSQVYSGSMRVINERDLDEALKRRGWDVVHPEQLAFAEQVHLFQTREVLCGVAGSAFHTSLFTEATGRRIILSMDDHVNSNFRLFDLLVGRPADYFRVEAVSLLEDLGPNHGGTPEQPFGRTYVFGDPAALADELTALL